MDGGAPGSVPPQPTTYILPQYTPQYIPSETFSLRSPLSPFSSLSPISDFDMTPRISIEEPTLETVYISTMSPVEDVTLFVSPKVPNAPNDVIIPPIKMNAKIINSPVLSTTDMFGVKHLTVLDDIYVPSVQVMTSTNPLVSQYVLGDTCDLDNIKEDMSKYFHYKLLDKWLYEDKKSKALLKYLTVTDGHVKLIRKIDKVDDVAKNSQDVIDKKVKYIEDNVLSRDEVLLILKRFVESTRISWCSLQKNGFLVREAICKTLKNKLKRLIEQQ